TNRSAQRHKLRAYLADRRPVILAEIGNRLVIRNQATGEPHDLNVAASLTLKSPARLNAVEVTVDVELEQHRRMVRRSAGDFRINPVEPQGGQIELIHKYVDHTDRIVFANPIFKTFREQCALVAVRPFNKALHPIPPQIAQES